MGRQALGKDVETPPLYIHNCVPQKSAAGLSYLSYIPLVTVGFSCLTQIRFAGGAARDAKVEITSGGEAKRSAQLSRIGWIGGWPSECGCETDRRCLAEMLCRNKSKAKQDAIRHGRRYLGLRRVSVR